MSRFRLEIVPECGSTNEVLLNLRDQPDFAGRALLALRQSAGRGRRGRAWDSGEGNLALSIAWRLPAHDPRVGLLSFLLGLALHRAVEPLLPPASRGSLRLKWPNDLYLGGGKLAGMLTQARQGEGVDLVLGVGVNLARAPEGVNAVSLASVAGEVGPEEFARALLAELDGAWPLLADFPALRAEWESRARLGEGALYVVGEPAALTGVALLPSGELLVRDASGRERALASEEVSLRYEPTAAPSL